MFHLNFQSKSKNLFCLTDSSVQLVIQHWNLLICLIFQGISETTMKLLPLRQRQIIKEKAATGIRVLSKVQIKRNIHLLQVYQENYEKEN